MKQKNLHHKGRELPANVIYNSCKRKSRYNSYDEADRAAKKHFDSYYIYDCNICNGWHISAHGTNVMCDRRR